MTPTRTPPLVFALVALALFSSAAQAQMFKCKTPEGRLAVQDTPCAADLPRPQDRRDPQAGQKNEEFARRKPMYNTDASDGSFDARRAVAAPTYVPPAPSYAAPPAAAVQQVAGPGLRRSGPLAAGYDDYRCNTARKNLGVLKSGSRPGYYDNNGDFRPVYPEQRGPLMEEAQRQIAQYCPP